MANERWEEQLRAGLDQLSDLGQEEPPNLADLQMLVVQVQREQKSRTLRDLALFWLCAVALLAGGLYAFSRQPTYFMLLQGAAMVGLVAAGAVHLGRERKRVTE